MVVIRARLRQLDLYPYARRSLDCRATKLKRIFLLKRKVCSAFFSINLIEKYKWSVRPCILFHRSYFVSFSACSYRDCARICEKIENIDKNSARLCNSWLGKPLVWKFRRTSYLMPKINPNLHIRAPEPDQSMRTPSQKIARHWFNFEYMPFDLK